MGFFTRLINFHVSHRVEFSENCKSVKVLPRVIKNGNEYPLCGFRGTAMKSENNMLQLASK